MSRYDDVVPLADPKAENALFKDALLKAAESVIDSGWYILGPHVSAFEQRLAESIGVAGAVGVGTGTDALAIAMQALGIGPGDEVIAPSHTAGPSIAAIHMVGATPVLVDIDAESFCVAPSSVANAISDKTKAVLAIHLYGHPADIAGLRHVIGTRDIKLIEDCAQAQGAALEGRAVGGIGDVGCFSFYPTKALGALGDGGAISSPHPAVLERVRWLRTYGWKRPQFAEVPGGRCSRLDELQAALLNVKIAHLEAMNNRRRAIAAAYSTGLAGLPIGLPAERADCRHVYHLYVVRSAKRDALERWLNERNIGTGRHYPFPTHQQPALRSGSRVPAPLVETERAANEILSLPMFSSMTDSQVARVVDAVRSFSER